MKLLLTYLKRYKKILIGALILAAINQTFSLLDPQIFRLLIDNYATKIDQMGRQEFLSGVFLLLIASVTVALISRIAKNFQDYFVNATTQRVGTTLYSNMIEHAFSLPYRVFEDQRSGELLRKAEKARDDTQKFIASAINVIFLSAVGMIIVIGYAFYVHWLIGIVYIALIPTLGITTFIISRRVQIAQKKIVLESGNLAGSTIETLRNVELVKSLGLENQETKRLNEVNENILQLELKKITIIRTLSFIQGTLVNITRSVLLFIMLWLIFNQQITIGEFFTLMFYSFAIFSPLYELGSVASQYQESKASLLVAQSIFDQWPEPKPATPKTITGLEQISFNKISFSYSNSDIPSLLNISLQMKPGSTVAFVGPSGSGKSTIIKLLVGLYPPTSGKLMINGILNSDIDIEQWRKKIGYVSQDTQLFAGTIGDNLRFVRPDATDQQCIEALEQSAIKNIIDRGGKGLDTVIGEGGLKLSGGERQRLAIARALLRQPQIIIFDEATSSLDSLTEKSITETIYDISAKNPNLLTILVAHRLSTVLHADMIYVLEHGQIIESDSHDKLVENGSLYAAIWREQQGQNGD
ncbi:MAG TPA: ABC transporter ATP-binding protein [Patescibacteria group bacterium]|nr:ABC transporter ATP-binding protein [Patescibacteria group bacterium]